jgi:hypothetical protein
MLLCPAFQQSLHNQQASTNSTQKQSGCVSKQQKKSDSGLAVSSSRGKKPRIASGKSKASSWKQMEYSIMKNKEGREASRYIFAGVAQTDFYQMPSSSVHSICSFSILKLQSTKVQRVLQPTVSRWYENLKSHTSTRQPHPPPPS